VKFFITKKVLVFIIILLSLIIMAICIQGCGPAGVRPPELASKPAAGVPGVLQRIALLSAWIGGIGIIASLIGFVFAPNKWLIAKMLALAVVLLVGANVVAFIALHSGAFTAIGIGLMVCVIAALAWKYIGAIENWLKRDLDGNGDIGNDDTQKIPIKDSPR
jgi:hypothetical protein